MTPTTALAALTSLNAISAEVEALRAIIAPFTVEQPKPEPAFDLLTPLAEFEVPDTLVAPGQRVAWVRLCLKQPVRYQVRALAQTLDGSAVKAPLKGAVPKWAYYGAASLDAVWRPGETVLWMKVDLHRNLDAKSLSVSINHSVNQPPIAPARGIIRQIVGDEQPTAGPPDVAPVYPAAPDPLEGRTLVYRTDFVNGAEWDKRGGFWQSGNEEAAIYCDPDMKDQGGFDPHPIVDGKRVLRMIRQDVTVDYKNGRLTKPYRAPMLNSKSVFRCHHGDYVELRWTPPKDTDGVPAFWLVGSDPDYLEMDITEYGLGDKPGHSDTVHYTRPDGKEPAEGVLTSHAPDGSEEVIGLLRDDAYLYTFVNGVEVHRREAIGHGRNDLWVIINNTIGGKLRSDPKWPLGKTEDIVLGEFRAYRKAA